MSKYIPYYSQMKQDQTDAVTGCYSQIKEDWTETVTRCYSQMKQDRA